jgi:hypothetical protein
VRRRFDRINDRLPGGWTDVVRQLGLFACAYMGYQLVRGIVSGDTATAIANGQRVIDFEAKTGTLFEPHLQHYLLNTEWLIDFANFMYINSHFVITTTFLVWLYLQRNESFYFVRNMFLIAMGLAIVGYALYPCAPPRLFHDAGFVDTVREVNNSDSGIEHIFVNAYAAVPSMHCGFSLMVGATGVMVCRARAARVLWALYPALVFFVVVVTANHFWVDGALGWMVAALSAVGAMQLARSRPAVWSFRPVEARA